MSAAVVTPGTPAAPLSRRRTGALWAAAVALAVVHTWPYRFRLVNLDAVSYLDLADAWRAGHWREAVNAYWSPAYSWVLAAALALVDPQPQHEYVLLHAVNVVLFVVALAAFWMLVRELVQDLPLHGTSWSPAEFAAIAMLLFMWIATTQIVVWMESPDLIPGAATFAASALLLRLRRNSSAGVAALLGLVLGVGYLGKAAMFPLAFVFLLMGAIAAARARAVIVLAALVAFAAVAAPWIAVLSRAKGRPTSGDAGRINYLYFVNRSEDWPRHWPAHWPHWDGIEGRGEPAHAARRLHADPAVYEFATPFTATYPMWYDPSYWHEGVSPAVDLRDQLRRLRLSAWDYVYLFTVNFYNRDFFNPQPALAALLLVLWLAAARPRPRWKPAWILIGPSAATLAMYGAVYVEPRYVGAAILVIWLALLAGVRLPGTADAARVARGVCTALLVVLAAAIVISTISEAGPGWRRLLRGEPDETNVPWHIARMVHEAGIAPGASVGIIGNAQVASRWARLGRVRIVAEMPPADLPRFVAADPQTVGAVLDAFARTPAVAVLAEEVPVMAPAGWTRVEATPYWIFRPSP